MRYLRGNQVTCVGCLILAVWNCLRPEAYSDVTRVFTPKWWLSKGNPLISYKPRLVKYYDLARCIFWCWKLSDVIICMLLIRMSTLSCFFKMFKTTTLSTEWLNSKLFGMEIVLNLNRCTGRCLIFQVPLPRQRCRGWGLWLNETLDRWTGRKVWFVFPGSTQLVPSLKLTCSHLKMNGWNTIISFCSFRALPLFGCELLVSCCFPQAKPSSAPVPPPVEVPEVSQVWWASRKKKGRPDAVNEDSASKQKLKLNSRVYILFCIVIYIFMYL